MAVVNDTVTAGSVRVNGTSTQTWATHFTNANASNIKNIGTNNSVRQVTSNAAAGSSNGTIQLQLASGNILDLTGNKVLIVGAAPRPVDANGAATTTQVSNSYIDISDGSVLQLEGGGTISEWTAPMKGNATSKIMNNSGLIFWNSVQPGVALDGTQIVCAPNAGGGDAHFGYNPAAYVKNVKIEFLQTTNNQMIFSAQAIWGTDRVKAQDGIVITSTKGMTNISLFSWNQTAVPWLAGGNNFFMVYRDMGYNVGSGSQPTALKRSYRRAGWNTPGVTSYWYNQGQMSCAYVHVDVYTTLNASGVDTGVKTYIRKVDYINVGTVSTDNNAWDVVALRYSPTITDALGSPLANAHIKVTCSSSSVIAGTPYGTQKSPIAAIGYTGSDGKFVITEPVTPNYNTNTTYYTDTFVGKTHAPSGKFHKFWEAGVKYVITNDSRGTVGFDIGAVYAPNEYSLEVRRAGYVVYSSSVTFSGPVSGGVALTEDTNYNSASSTTGIAVTYASGVTTVTPSAGTYTLDQIYKAIIDFHFTTANLEASTVIPVTQNTGALTFGSSLVLNVNSTHTLTAGSKVTSINTTQNISFNGSGQASADFIYTTSVGTSTTWRFEDVQVGTSLVVYDSSGVTKYFRQEVSTAGTYSMYIPPGTTGTYYYAVEKYGKKREEGNFPANSGGILFYVPDYQDDVGITQATKATVAAYTTLETSEKLYDYIAYFRLGEQGIKLGQIATRSGTAIDFGTYSGVVKATHTSVLSITGSTITFKANGLAGTTKYATIIATPPATWTANSTEVITIDIEDGNGDSSITISASAVSTFEIWKITDATDPDDYATGTLMATVGIGKWRFLHANGYKFVIRDITTNYRVVVEAEKGVYEAALFFGAAVQLAQAAEVTEINNKVDIMQIDVDAIKGTGFLKDKHSLTNIKKKAALAAALSA